MKYKFTQSVQIALNLEKLIIKVKKRMCVLSSKIFEQTLTQKT